MIHLVRFGLLSGPSFGIKLFTRLAICSLCILAIGYFSYFPDCLILWVLIASVPGNCILVTFTLNTLSDWSRYILR